MVDPHSFALRLARAVQLIHDNPATAGDADTILPLAHLAGRQSATLRLQDGELLVEGSAVPSEQAFIPDLIERMSAHGVAAVFIAHGASAADLMQLAQALAGDAETADPTAIARHLRKAHVSDVVIVDVEADRAAAVRRAQTTGTAPVQPLASGSAALVESAEPAAAPPLLEDVLKRLRKPPARDPFAALAAAADGVREAVAARHIHDAADALLALVRQEVQLGEGPLRLQYDVTVRRLLTRETLRALAGLLLDAVYRRDVMEIMQRAGSAGTEELLNGLIEAPTFAERRALLDALRAMRQGTDILVRMLDHHEWFVVRNVADLVGDLRVEDSVDRLGEAVAHADVRVRKSAAVALARIGTPAAVKHLWKALRDVDPQVRAEAARAVSGRGFQALAMPLVSAAESEADPSVKAEFYRALGRIGTPEAVQALKKAAAAGRAEAKKALRDAAPRP